jgi:short-subunit dehydrogenase
MWEACALQFPKSHMKPLRNQVIVITGASHGTGLQLAQRAATAGANLVLVARGKESLKDALLQMDLKTDFKTDFIPSNAIAIVADVADPEEMEFVAREAITHFGRIDAWVNNASIANSRKLTETHLMEKREIFEINFWGMVHGCRAALPYLRDSHGTLLNIGSADVRRSIYCVSKYAVQGYSDTLRYELEKEHSDVQVKCLDVPPDAKSDWIVGAAVEAIEERDGVFSRILPSTISASNALPKVALVVGGIAGIAAAGFALTPVLRRAIQNSQKAQDRPERLERPFDKRLNNSDQNAA